MIDVRYRYQPAKHNFLSTEPGKFKVVADPIHQTIPLDDQVVKMIDTPEFQRLRDLKQLGTTCFVFPGASHNRFEHSIGVSHVSRQFIDHLHFEQPELGITDNERMYVRIAGLCHDLGHGPFSHGENSRYSRGHTLDSYLIAPVLKCLTACSSPKRCE